MTRLKKLIDKQNRQNMSWTMKFEKTKNPKSNGIKVVTMKNYLDTCEKYGILAIIVQPNGKFFLVKHDCIKNIFCSKTGWWFMKYKEAYINKWNKKVIDSSLKGKGIEIPKDKWKVRNHNCIIDFKSIQCLDNKNPLSLLNIKERYKCNERKSKK